MDDEELVADLIEAGASDDEIRAILAKRKPASPGARFADPNVPAQVQGTKEQVRATMVKGQPTGNRPLDPEGGVVETALQRINPFQDEISGAVSAAGSLLPGGRSPGEAYTEERDASRSRSRGFARENPLANTALTAAGMVLPALATGGATLAARGAVNAGRAAPAITGAAKVPLSQLVKAGAKTGAVAGGVYSAGASEGTLKEKAIQTGLGAGLGAALGAGVPAAIRGGSKLPKLVGITTEGGRQRVASEKIASVIERSGQAPDDVLARAEAFIAEHGRPPTLAEAIGDDAAEMALNNMLPIRDPSAGVASRAAEVVGGDKSRLGRAYLRAAKQPEPSIGVPTLGLKYSLPAKAVTAGLRHSGTRESETLLDRLTQIIDPDDLGRVVQATIDDPKALPRGPLVTPPAGPRPAGGVPEYPALPHGAVRQPGVAERKRLGPGPRLAEAIAERKALPPGSGETIGKLVDPAEEQVQRELMEMLAQAGQRWDAPPPVRVVRKSPARIEQKATILPETAARKQRGPSPAAIERRNQHAKDLLARRSTEVSTMTPAQYDDITADPANLEALLSASLNQVKRLGRSGSLRSSTLRRALEDR